jgi:hypothetical protein
LVPHVRSLDSPRTAQPKKRGSKGYFVGSRLEFLNRYRDEYISLRRKNRSKFWLKFFDDWWKTYPWRLADDEEPPTGDTEKMETLSQVGGNHDHDLKSSVEKRLREVGILRFRLSEIQHD